jgi:hypothetical protein
MENKYFTPDIEDIYIGYVLEHLSATGYIVTKFEIDSSLPALQELIKLNQIRVPYLTKEQIEAEGWEYEKEIKTVQCYDKENIFIAYSEKTHRMLIRKHNNETWKTIYFGRCKDINAFRKIIKLLEI